MQSPRQMMRLIVALGAVLGASTAVAQQDGLVAFPNVYRVQFENDWVRLIRVNVPGKANLAMHNHPPGYMIHVYFNDAESIVFEHDGSPFSVTRPPVKARSYRIGRATPETHAVINEYPGASDYMRVEFKTSGYENTRNRIPAPPIPSATGAVVEVTTTMFRSTRVTIAARDSLEVATTATEPALFIALTGTVGQERFIDTGRREVIKNSGDVPLQFLRVDFLSRPVGR